MQPSNVLFLILIAFKSCKASAIDESCDPGNDSRGIDWDNATSLDYTCLSNEPVAHGNNGTSTRMLCRPIDYPSHRCLNSSIIYKDLPPLSGPHRPVLPRYGEYLYLPPQRYVNSLKHGAAVFLYHPCTKESELRAFRQLARSCLYRYVFTPSRLLTQERPFAILTWGCMLSMGQVDIWLSRHYIRRYAISQAPEGHISTDGQYSRGLLHPATIVSNQADLLLCPKTNERIKFSSLFKITSPPPKTVGAQIRSTAKRREPLAK